MVDEASERGQETAVLFSGGLDSAVLVAHEAQRGPVRPIYVAAGLAWEAAEERFVARLLAAGAFGPRVRPVVRLSVDMRDVYPPSHWAVRGEPPGGRRALADRLLHPPLGPARVSSGAR